MFGLDYVTGPPIEDLKAFGVAFVCRYLSEVNALTQVKLLSANEAKTLGVAGISVVSNYEWYANRALESAASGVADAQIAASQHAACGGPQDSPIYFSVDCDVSGEQTADYFRGVASVIGLSRTGAYGSYRVIQYLLDNHLITWAWQTYAWSAGQWDSRAHIQQYANGVALVGFSVDYNRAMQADFGQWLPGGNDMLDITNAWVAAYFTQTGTSPDRWHCVKTGQDLFAGILAGWKAMNGAPRLPIGGETKCGTQAVYQECESGIVLYDPAHELDAPHGPWEPCYLLKLDSDLAKKVLALSQVSLNVADAIARVQMIEAAAGAVLKDLGAS